jgi:serine/threonine protein kinase
MHKAGMCHVDVKSGNIFLDIQGGAFLGDYGSTVPHNSIPHEASIATHWPSNLNYAATPMTAALDYYLLAVTLLELAGVIELDPSKGALSSHKVRGIVSIFGESDAEFLGFSFSLTFVKPIVYKQCICIPKKRHISR